MASETSLVTTNDHSTDTSEDIKITYINIPHPLLQVIRNTVARVPVPASS